MQSNDSLRSGGGTAMGSGMQLAYRHALKKASSNVVSRVIILTDGDTNAKAPDGAEAAEQAFPFERSRVRSSLESASPDFRFALAVASTADILRHSPWVGTAPISCAALAYHLSSTALTPQPT